MLAFSARIDGPWLEVAPVRVGRDPADFEMPDRYLTATVGAGRRVRVDVYRGNETCLFEEAREWHGWLVVGWGEHLHWVDPNEGTARTFHLGSYFGHLYPEADSLFVASAERLFGFDPSGQLAWTSEVLGFDGVVLNSSAGDVLEGCGEWDPPDGWRPFRISRADGKSFDAKPG